MNLFYFLVWIGLLIQTQSFNFKQLANIQSSKTINVKATYTFIMYRSTTNAGISTTWNSQAVSSVSAVSVTFPSEYSLTGSETCLTLDVISASQTYSLSGFSCSVSGNTISFQNSFTTVTDLYVKQVTINIGNILNPSPAVKTGSFTGSVGADIAVSNGGTAVQLEPATFSSCKISFGNGGYVNSTSPAIIQLIPLNGLNSTSTIKIFFPTYKFWLNDLSSTILPISQGSMNCTSISNVLSGITCLGSYTAFTVTSSSLFSSSIVSGTGFSYQINNFLSPPSMQPLDQIKITSYTNNYEVDTCLIYVSQLIPKPLLSLTIKSIQSPMIVNSKVGLSLNMTFSDTINQLDTFTITFPNTLTVTYVNVSTSGSQGNSVLNGRVLSVELNTLSVINYWAQSFFVINFYTFTGPTSIKQTDPIIVAVTRNGFQKMIGSATLIASPSTITCLVNVQNKTVSSNTLFLFNVTLNDSLSSSGWLSITFPSQITLPSTISTVILSGPSMKSTPICTVNAATNQIRLTSLNLSSSNIAAQSFNLTIGPINNVGTTKPSSGFSISSYYQPTTDYLVATASFNGITATQGVISSSGISIVKSSDIVLDSAVTYTFNFVVSSDIPQNGIIQIEIPNDIQIDLTNLPTNCFQQINSLTQISADCTGNLNPLTNIYLITISSIAATQKVSNGSRISISLSSLCTNPSTTRNIINFSISTFSDSYIIQSRTSGISTRASTPSQCLNVGLIRSSEKNSDISNYTVRFKQTSDLLAQSYVVLTIPTQLIISTGSQCVDLGTGVVLLCTVLGNVITVKMANLQVANQTLISVVITNIVNTATFQPLTDPLIINTKTPDNINRYCQYTSSIAITNKAASSFISLTGEFSPRIYGQTTSLSITLQASQRIIPSYLIISLAASLSVSSLTCSFQNIINPVCTQSQPNNIKITGTFSSASMQLIIGGLKAPKYNQSTPQLSSVSSFSAINYKIDQSSPSLNKIEFIVQCVLPCKTCLTTNNSQCLSCYQDITIDTNVYYYSPAKFCYSICPNGYFQYSTVYQCQPCNPICATCQLTANNCTSCALTSTVPYFNQTSSYFGTCLGTCPMFYYPDLTLTIVKCVLCVPPCKDCTTKLTCLSCVSPYYFFEGSCRSSCPSGTTIPDILTLTCNLCATICATCAVTINKCVTCSSTAAFYDNSCVSACPPPLVINAGRCASCDTLCKTCDTTSTNCTSCDTASIHPYLFNYSCFSLCPDFYYKDILSGTCKQCTLLGIGCKNCSSVSSCYSCDTSFVFLSNKCYATIPTGYYNNNGFAQPCSGGCATCLNLATNCTACKSLNLEQNLCVAQCANTTVSLNKICTPCETPCLTCSNIKSNCTSCIPNLSPLVFFNNYYCTTTCPNYTYANATTNVCAGCKTPCLMCTSDAACISCVNGMFLAGTSCINICLPGFIGINKVCAPCTLPCATCDTIQTRCLSCANTFYLYNSSSPSCVLDCTSVGLYPDVNTQTCTGCQSSCKTCQNTSGTCTSCNTNSVLYNNICIGTCPVGYYNNNGFCNSCPSQCKTCSSSQICQSCSLNYYFYVSSCVSSCPSNYPVITNIGSCSMCSDTACSACLNNDYCSSCLGPFILYLGKCVSTCPTNYSEQTNNVTLLKQCVYNETEAKVSAILSGGNLFPVPFTIAAIFIGIATIMSKFQHHSTFVQGVLYSLWGLLEWASLWVTAYFFYQNQGLDKVQMYILLAAITFLYVLNLFALIAQNIYLMSDKSLNKWLNSQSNRYFYYTVSILSLFTSHKFKNFIYCKMFNFTVLKACLDSVQNFRVYNFFSFLSFLSSAAVLFGLGLIYWTYTITANQSLMSYIDTTILTIVNIVLAILNSNKNDTFFEETTEQGYVFNKRILSSDQIFNDLVIPSNQEQDHYFKTANKLVTPTRTNYRHLESETSEYSVRNMSIQAESMLGQQSRISRLDSHDISNFNIFEQKQVSIQYDEPPAEVQDKSINMSIKRQNEMSIQMDCLSQNQISIQVSRQYEEVSVQYAPNYMDQQVGMSREHANEVSVQYSVKPIFLNIDQDYTEGEQQQLSQTKNAMDDSQMSRSRFIQQIPQPDTLLKAELELDIDEKLRKRQSSLILLQQQKKKQQKMKAIANFQKKKQLKQQQAFSIEEGNTKKINDVFNNDDTKRANSSLYDSKDDILKLHKVNTKQNSNDLIQSNQSRVKNSNEQNDSFGGQKTQQQFIQMLSGNKNLLSQQQSYNNILEINLQKKVPHILRVQNQSQLQDSNQISLNITQQAQTNNFAPKKEERKNYIFENHNQKLMDSQNDEDKIQKLQQIKSNEYAKSNQYTKSISTKFISTQKYRPPLPKNHSKPYSDSSQNLQTSYQKDNESQQFNIIDGPIQPRNHNMTKINHYQRQYKDHNKDHDKKTNLTQFLERKARLKSQDSRATDQYRERGILQRDQLDQQIHNDSDQYDIEQENLQKQQPLALPSQQFQQNANNLQFGQDEKVSITPLNSEQIQVSRGMPRGLKSLRKTHQPKLKPKKSLQRLPKSRSKQKPLYNQLFNPSNSLKKINNTGLKQLQKEERKAQNRKRQLLMMEGMLERPANNRKSYAKDNQEIDMGKRKSVEKIYLNKNGFKNQ